MNKTYLELLQNNVPIIFDGAMGTTIQGYNLTTADFGGLEGCNEILNLKRRDVVTDIHRQYIEAGAMVLETNTFGANAIKLGEYGLEKDIVTINTEAVTAARRAINDSKKTTPLFVCGTMGPSGILLSTPSTDENKVTFNTLAGVFAQQAEILMNAGADLLLLETMQDLLEVRAAMIGINRMFGRCGKRLPLQVQVSMDTSGHMLLGSDCNAFLGAVAGLNPAAIGLNCNTGPTEMLSHIVNLLNHSPMPVSAQPNAGAPENVNGVAVYQLSPNEFATALAPMVLFQGLSICGGCCGTTPAHIQALANELQQGAGRVHTRKVPQGTFVASGITGVNLECAVHPFIIGERLNAQGSKKTKELILARNYDELNVIAQEQIVHQSTLLDLCVAINERDDESQTMEALVGFLSDRVTAPLCIDSTEPAVIAAALQRAPGACLINSINLEKNGDKARIILALAREYGCPVVALTIDDAGMARTIDQKLSVARRLYELACGEFGLPAGHLYIDPLVFTLAAADADNTAAASNALEAIRRIKIELPGVHTVMGVSNVSYGFAPAARRVLNNVMLHHAAAAGLDAAIFNPLHVDKIQSYAATIVTAAEALIFNWSTAALTTFIELFDKKPVAKKDPAGPVVTLSPEQVLYQKILQRDRRDLEQIIAGLLKTTAAETILNTILLPAMAAVGDKMATGEMILPFVLQAAEVMQAAVAVLQPHLKSAEPAGRGTMVLATVYGDIHDIGKNLVGAILRNQGFNIIDLGKQVPLNAILEAVKTNKVDAVGLSALLVTTSREMERCVQEFAKAKLSIPVIIGGAAVSTAFAQRIALQSDGSNYAGGVYYARDAFDAVKILDAHKSGKAIPHAATMDDLPDTLISPVLLPATMPAHDAPPEPPFWGTSEILIWNAGQLFEGIKADRLYKGHWKAGNLSEQEFNSKRAEEFEPAFVSLKREILELELLDARAFYGFFPVVTDNTRVILLDPADHVTERCSFAFPRVKHRGGRSLADFLRPEGDLIAVQIVTTGSGISRRIADYFNRRDHYSRGFYLNGIASYLAENLADRVSAEIRRSLMLEQKTGRRYSFGYSGMPGVEDQAQLFELLSIEERLGIELTAGFQMVPEHSTLGLFVLHPEAEYL